MWYFASALQPKIPVPNSRDFEHNLTEPNLLYIIVTCFLLNIEHFFYEQDLLT